MSVGMLFFNNLSSRFLIARFCYIVITFRSREEDTQASITRSRSKCNVMLALYVSSVCLHYNGITPSVATKLIRRTPFVFNLLT